MKFGSGVLLLILTMPLSACAKDSKHPSNFWSSSIAAFNAGNAGEGVRIAKENEGYNVGTSDFLVTQYMTYEGMEHAGNVENASEYYKNMERIDLSDPDVYVDSNSASVYRGRYIAAKVFAKWHLDGSDSAIKLFTSECDRWKKFDPDFCVRYLMRDAANSYEGIHGRFDAVYLYEISQFAGQLHTLSYPVTGLYTAISLMKADNIRASSILRQLELEGELSFEMKQYYCKVASEAQFEQRSIACDQR